MKASGPVSIADPRDTLLIEITGRCVIKIKQYQKLPDTKSARALILELYLAATFSWGGLKT